MADLARVVSSLRTPGNRAGAETPPITLDLPVLLHVEAKPVPAETQAGPRPPRSPAGVNGGELSHSVAPSKEGSSPSTGSRAEAVCSPAGMGQCAVIAMLSLWLDVAARGSRLVPSRVRAAARRWCAPPVGVWLAQCPERRADFFGEEVRLFPGGEVAALGGLVVVDEVGVGPFGPAPRRLVLLAGEDGDGHRDGDALGVEEAGLVFPVQAGRRDPGV